MVLNTRSSEFVQLLGQEVLSTHYTAQVHDELGVQGSLLGYLIQVSLGHRAERQDFLQGDS